MKWKATLLVSGLAFGLFAALLMAQAKKPVYVGSRACGGCHAGKGMGDQYSLWLHSKHSQAYAALARPESKEIAAISGLRQEPQQAAICLGCHATAYNAEAWEKDDTFRLEEGVQCEACHGPGSEYMAENVMRNREAAMRAGLRMPTEKECMTCHIEKGSHVAVLRTPRVEMKAAMQSIAHPTPAHAMMGSIPKPMAADGRGKSGPQYVGSQACGKCHDGPMMNHQYSVWRKGPHAQGWSVLATPKAYEMAALKRLKSEPQRETACLTCHTTYAGGDVGYLESYAIDEGVGCEACHGPGSEYMPEAIMRDKRAAMSAGLQTGNHDSCLRCHLKAHGKAFNLQEALQRLGHPNKLPPAAEAPRYKTPVNLALHPGGKELYVACEGADTVIVIDTGTRRKLAEIPVGGQPADVTFTPDGKRAFASNRHDDTVSVIDVAARRVVGTLAAGDEPHGVLTDRQGRLLYVLNTASGDISVFDAATLKQTKTLSASRGPWSLALSPDGSAIAATNMLSRFAFREPFVSEVTVIETERGVIEDRWLVRGANLMMGIAWHPSGKFALATLNRTKTLIPMTRLMQGWTITNGLAVLWRDGRVDQVLLDEPDMGFADAADVAVTPDGRYALVTSSGTNRVAVIDINKLTGLIARSSKYDREEVLPNHLGKASEFVVKHIAVETSPRGLLITPDNLTAYVTNALDDSLTVIDIPKLSVAGRIDLGGPKVISKARYGERLFNNARITFRRQYSCHSCHPDGHVDAMTYDIEADGVGISPVDNRTLRGVLDTAPFKWEGTNPSLSRQCGPRLAMFFTRGAPFTPEELAAVDYYVTTIPRPVNRFRPLGASLTAAQRRGKAIYERTRTNDGREIPVQNRCVTCHPAPYFTDRQVHDIGTRHIHDRQGRFDTPHLNNIYDSAPYLHNGMAPTLEEIWTVYNPDDKHGVTNDMTKDQLNDLIEYLKTL
jgi:YVTN family beta-propeller protein